MKNVIVLCFVMLGLSLTACSRSGVNAGVEGVMTMKPYLFGKGGVDPNPIRAGAIWTAWSTDVDRYNMKPMRTKESFIDLTASDNVAIDFDVYLTLQIIKGKSPILHEQYGKSWYSEKVQDTFRGFVRNEARTHSSIALRTNEKTIIAAQDTMKDLIKAYIRDENIPVRVVKVNIGKVVPPDEVLAEAAKTAAQKQAKQTQVERKSTEDARAGAERSAALADKAYAKEFKMTTRQFLKNKELDIMAKAVEKGGVSLIMNASSAQPIFNVK